MRTASKLFFLFFLSAFLALPALAQVPAEIEGTSTKHGGCKEYQWDFCAGGVDCLSADFTIYPYVVNAGNAAVITIQENFLVSSRTGAMACRIRWSTTGYSTADYAELRDYSTGTVIELTDTVPDLIFSGNLPYWWVHCVTVTGGQAAFKARACTIK